jgi:hypothetical protein
VNKTLTVILPVHNAEATLRRDVHEVLQIAGELATELRLFIVDDGSTDDTFDVATELAVRYPQMRVMRHAQQQGLGPAIESLRSIVGDELVLVHDGASPVKAEQIGRYWLQHEQQGWSTDDDKVSIDDLRRAAAAHAPMAAAHMRLAGFQRLTHVANDNTQLSRRDKEPKQGVGVIPPLPRPNFMGALAEFAIGE